MALVYEVSKIEEFICPFYVCVKGQIVLFMTLCVICDMPDELWLVQADDRVRHEHPDRPQPWVLQPAKYMINESLNTFPWWAPWSYEWSKADTWQHSINKIVYLSKSRSITSIICPSLRSWRVTPASCTCRSARRWGRGRWWWSSSRRRWSSVSAGTCTSRQ